MLCCAYIYVLTDSGDGRERALRRRWSTDHASGPVRLLINQRHDQHRPWSRRLPVEADGRRRTAHQSDAHQLRWRRPSAAPGRHRVDHPPPRPRCAPSLHVCAGGSGQASAQGLLPAGQHTRAAIHTSADRVRGIASHFARVPVHLQRRRGRRHRRQSPQSSLPTSLPR